jgi:hypothetical protein
MPPEIGAKLSPLRLMLILISALAVPGIFIGISAIAFGDHANGINSEMLIFCGIIVAVLAVCWAGYFMYKRHLFRKGA